MSADAGRLVALHPFHYAGYPLVLILLACSLLLPRQAAAQTSPEQAPHDGRVVQQIVLIRHGIRAPTEDLEKLAPYAAEAWPAWSVAPGQLSAHGALLMKSLGVWYRQELNQAGLALGPCGHSGLRMIADSTPRNRASAAAMQAGLQPGCAVGYDAYPADRNDPLFQGIGAPDDQASAPPVSATSLPTPLLDALRHVLFGCHDRVCLDAAAAAGKHPQLGDTPDKLLKRAGNLAENLMLTYVEELPGAGWGRLSDAGVGGLIVLHNLQFSLTKKALPTAQARGGNLLAYIAATLATTAGEKPALPSLTDPGQHVVVLLGHDTNLATQAGLLRLDWHSHAQPDDYPPGGGLIFSLVESGRTPDGSATAPKRYGVRISVAMPTLAALRTANVDTAGMHVEVLQQPACGGLTICPLDRFLALTMQAVGDQSVLPGSGREPHVP